jgi:hypothetical protein
MRKHCLNVKILRGFIAKFREGREKALRDLGICFSCKEAKADVDALCFGCAAVRIK